MEMITSPINITPMTKEQILKNHIIKHRFSEEYIDNPYLSAMQEYAEKEKEKEAVEFTDWIVGKGTEEFISKWYIDEITTTELYKIFKTESNGK